MDGWTPPRIAHQLRAILACLPDDHDVLYQACEAVDDWRALLTMADEQGVAGVVIAGIEGAGIAAAVAESQQAMRQMRPSTVWRDVLRDTLRDILAALFVGGIEAVPLKGPLLAARLYGEDTLRPSTDLDVLVSPASLDAAIDALRPLGYMLEGGKVGRFFRDHHHHVHLLHPALPVVELHFDAYRGFGTVLPAESLIARSIPCNVPGWNDVRVLAPEDEFLYLAVHAASHRFERLVWLYDLKLLLRRHPNLRWDVLAARAEARHLSAVVSFTCVLLSMWLGTNCLGSAYLLPLGNARRLAAEYLLPAQSGHVLNAAADFVFRSLLCDDAGQVAVFVGRVVRVKVCHEAPLRLRTFFSN
jgi:hypothetical protein